MPDLLDASVWLPLSADDHAHHDRAVRYWTTEAADELAFCRVTSLALLRLLTNRHAMGEDALDAVAAWQGMRKWLSQPNVTFLGEPTGLDEMLGHWASILDIRGRDWTDAYLAAFATASGSRLVSFDSDFARYPGLAWLHLEAS